MRAFSAPGKLVIAGEYAVLEGRPALVAAVDRRAVCRLEPGEGLTVSGLGKGPLPVRVERSREVEVQGDDEGVFRLVAYVLSAARAAAVELPEGHLLVESDALYVGVGGEKLGLGSSAAVAVALAACVVGSASREDRDRVHRIARSAHLRFTPGGSGVDVAAAAYGGVLRFQRRGDDEIAVSPWPLCPGGLSLVCAFTGRSQSTRELVGAVSSLRERDVHAHAASIDEIDAATRAVLDAARAGSDREAFLDAIDCCRRAMRRLGEAAGADIVSAPHEAIAKIAREHGGAAKPSGAGGGDVALCFVPDERREALERGLEEAGYSVVPLEVGAEGAREERAFP